MLNCEHLRQWRDQGYGVVRELENAATEQSDKPTHECLIKDCGQLPSDTDLSSPSQVTLPCNKSDSTMAFKGCLHTAIKTMSTTSATGADAC